MKALKILFSEGSSLTARELLTVLGPRGHWIEVADPNSTCICRFSRYTKRVHRCPPSGTDPLGYLQAIRTILSRDTFDVLLPTHEQAWLFAVASSSFDTGIRPAVAAAHSFSRVQSKIEFARLLDEMKLPQPLWETVESPTVLAARVPPFYLKAPYSTAGTGVRRVDNAREAESAFHSLRMASGRQPIMLQSLVGGDYAQVQGLFDHGRLVAAHTSAQTAVGVGPSAAGRVSVDHSFARKDIALVGEYLDWHGGLTLDYIFRGQEHFYIECNPRTVEPANAVASGVDIPGLQLEISQGRHPAEVAPGRTGVKTHGSLAMVLGTAVYSRTRRAVLKETLQLMRHQDPSPDSHECVTPISRDLPSILPLLLTVGCALLSPAAAERLGQSTVKSYSVPIDAIQSLERVLRKRGASTGCFGALSVAGNRDSAATPQS